MILLILKIIGKILLILLFILLVLLLCLLFVPVFYNVEGNYTDHKPLVKCRISYMFPLIYICGGFEEKIDLKFRLLGICLYDTEKKNKTKPEKKNASKKNLLPNNSKEKKAEAKDAEYDKACQKKNDQDAPQIIDKAESDNKDINHTVSNTIADDSNSNKEAGASKPSLLQNIKNTISSVIKKIKDIIISIKNAENKAQEGKEKIISFYQLLTEEDMSKALSKGKTVLLHVLKKILPRKWNLYLHFGTGDPGSTGQMCAILGIMYPFVGSHIDARPDFEKTIYEGRLRMKGHIFLISIVIAGLTFLFHKDLKPLRDLLKNRL